MITSILWYDMILFQLKFVFENLQKNVIFLVLWIKYVHIQSVLLDFLLIFTPYPFLSRLAVGTDGYRVGIGAGLHDVVHPGEVGAGRSFAWPAGSGRGDAPHLESRHEQHQLYNCSSERGCPGPDITDTWSLLRPPTTSWLPTLMPTLSLSLRRVFQLKFRKIRSPLLFTGILLAAPA